MIREAQLACKCLFTPTFFRVGVILTRKAGQTDLVFGFFLWPGFTSRSVCARLQVSVCSDYDLCHPC